MSCRQDELCSLRPCGFRAAGYAAFASACSNSRVRGHAAATVRIPWAAFMPDRASLKSDEYNLSPRLLILCVLGGEDYLPLAHRRSGKSLCYRLGFLQCLGQAADAAECRGCEDRHKKRMFLVDHALVDHVAGNLESGFCRALAVACLQDIEFLVLDGELEVLHIAIVIFKEFADVKELLINLGQQFCHLINIHRCADTGNNVFALRVHKELAHQLLLAGSGVTGESNAGAAVIAHVTESHTIICTLTAVPHE